MPTNVSPRPTSRQTGHQFRGPSQFEPRDEPNEEPIRLESGSEHRAVVAAAWHAICITSRRMHQRGSKNLLAFVLFGLLLLAGWLGLSRSLAPAEIAAGALASVLACWLTRHVASEEPFSWLPVDPALLAKAPGAALHFGRDLRLLTRVLAAPDRPGGRFVDRPMPSTAEEPEAARTLFRETFFPASCALGIDAEARAAVVHEL